MGRVFWIRIGCSGCPEEVDVLVADLDEVERLNCECGYDWVLLSVSEAELSRPAAPP
jgi:hypothetical protein